MSESLPNGVVLAVFQAEIGDNRAVLTALYGSSLAAADPTDRPGWTIA
jgi:hypothetical protein